MARNKVYALLESDSRHELGKSSGTITNGFLVTLVKTYPSNKVGEHALEITISYDADGNEIGRNSIQTLWTQSHEDDATGVNHTSNQNPSSIPGEGSAPLSVIAVSSVASQVLVAANSSRKWLYIINNSVIDVFIAFGANSAVKNKGILIGKNGGVFEIDSQNLSVQAINGIALTGSPDILTQEGI